MNIGQKIKLLRERKGITLQEVGDLWGISRSSVSGWESGAAKPGIDKLPALARLLGVSIDELLNTSDLLPGAMRVVVAEDDSSEFYQIPMVKLKLQAGIMGIQTEPDNSAGGSKSVPRAWADGEGFNPDRLVAIQVKGESMEPTLYEGDTIVVNLDDTKLMDQAIFAVNYEGEAVVKRLSRDAGEWWLMSDNADQRKYHRKRCRAGECIIVGRVVRREGSRF